MSQVKSHVFSPEKLATQYKYQQLDITLANYGYIPYGQSLIGSLSLANPRNACLPLNTVSLNSSDPSPIIVVERGGCHFVTKSHYAQLYGAKMVIIIDNEFEKESSVIMIDDGYGFDIHIPTIMISKNDGEFITQFIPHNNVVMSFEFVSDRSENFVALEFWMSSYDDKSYEFLMQFRSFRFKLLKNVAAFTPHYALWLCTSCRDGNFSSFTENCLSNGRYCIPDVETTKLKSVTGREVVYEDLTQICLYFLDKNLWWDYIEDFYKNCLKNKDENLDFRSCSEKQYSTLGYQKEKVEMCINDSFIDKNASQTYDGENILLKQEQKTFMNEGIQLWPSLRINNETYRGNLLPIRGTINAVCESFKTEIDVCEAEFEKTLRKPNNNQTETGVSTTTFVLVSVFCTIILALLLFFIYQRKIRREMASDLQNQVNLQLSKYFSLTGVKK